MAVDPLSLNFGSDKPFYVYLYRDPRPRKRNQPVYVGKGSANGYRADSHWRYGSHNPFLNRVLDKIRNAGLEPTIEIVAWFDDEQSAFALEAALIARIGRRDLGSGPLTNLTEGGEGAAGIGDTTRAKLAAVTKGRWQDAEYAARMREMSTAHWADPEFRDRHAASMAEAFESPELRARLSAAQRALPIEQKRDRAKRMRDPDVRERANEGIRAALRSPGYRAYKSDAHREWWSAPENRAKNIEAMKAAQQRPEEKARKSAASKAVWAARKARALRNQDDRKD